MRKGDADCGRGTAGTYSPAELGGARALVGESEGSQSGDDAQVAPHSSRRSSHVGTAVGSNIRYPNMATESCLITVGIHDGAVSGSD
jgi:hypothetical protein